jgi:ribose 5-phosphate isomerase A
VSLQIGKEQAEQEKRIVAEAAARLVKNGMKVGLGSGSTSHYFIDFLGDRVKRGELRVEAVASSKESAALALQAGISLTEPRRGLRLDLAIDGADEIAPDLSLTKGGGGAHFREKVIAAAAAYFLVIADSSKLVQHLGAFPVPIEAIPFAAPWVMDSIQQIGGNPVLRLQPATTIPCLTDQQNYILDCHFHQILEPARLASTLEKIPGIVAHGLFIGYAKAALITQDSRVMVVRPGAIPEPISNFVNLP